MEHRQVNIQNPQPTNPMDAWTQDQCIMHWQSLKDALAAAKDAEMEMRKYVVSRAFPDAKEGMNNMDLGNGYTLKAGVKFNYKLPDNDKVEAGLKKLETLGNEGTFIADRLVSWTPNFLLKEFRILEEDAEKGSQFAKDALKIVYEFLEVSEAAPTLEIKEPKGKK